MSLLQYLAPGDPLPPTALALEYPNGLLAATDDVSPDRLTEAYYRGIFPWFEDPQPVLWWSPDPRSVLPVEALHVSRSLRRTLRRNAFRLSVDTAFREVMQACAGERQGQTGTWINERMLRLIANCISAAVRTALRSATILVRYWAGFMALVLARRFSGKACSACVVMPPRSRWSRWCIC